jgi:hypothetical protein
MTQQSMMMHMKNDLNKKSLEDNLCRAKVGNIKLLLRVSKYGRVRIIAVRKQQHGAFMCVSRITFDIYSYVELPDRGVSSLGVFVDTVDLVVIIPRATLDVVFSIIIVIVVT